MHEPNKRSKTGEEEMLSVSHLTGVTPRSEKTVYMFEAESTVGYKLVQPGDLAVNTMWAWMGAAGVSQHHGIVSPSYGVYRIDQSIVLPAYFDLLVRTPAYICEMTRYSRGVTSSRLRLYPDQLLALRTPVPPKGEQNEIVQQFEAAAEKGRSAINALDRQVELLVERRQALITAAVSGKLPTPGIAAVNSAGEAAFEAHIAGWLVDYGGYRRVKVGNLGAELSDFDSAAGVDTADLFEFIGATQPKEWDRLVNAGYGGDVRQARAGFVKRLASQLDRRGTVMCSGGGWWIAT